MNYCGVVAFRKAGGQVRGAVLRDAESGDEFEVAARVVVNATGAFCDEVRRLDDPAAQPIIAPSQGTHLVLSRDFLPGEAAIMVPHTDDGRVMFAIPWLGRVIVGTTDIAVPRAETEPRPQAGEIDFLLETANRYLARPASVGDVLSAFAGIRPLVSAQGKGTSSLSREHALVIDPLSGLLTIAGGKWTTYRRMAEDTVDIAQTLASLPACPCVTANLAIDCADPGGGEALHAALPLTAGQVRWHCREEMARRVEDVLARRSRCLLLDARAAREIAPAVARLMAAELGRDDKWISAQVADFTALAAGYDIAGTATA